MRVPDGVTGEMHDMPDAQDVRYTSFHHGAVVFLCPISHRWEALHWTHKCGLQHELTSFQDLALNPKLGTTIKTSTTIVPTGFVEVQRWCKREQAPTCVCEDHFFKLLVFVGETEGKKFDQGKVSASLLPPQALMLVAEVLEYGAKKYGRDNWRNVANADVRYRDAMMRHILAWLAKEDRDRESGLLHLAHATCCALFLLEAIAERQASTGAGPLDRMASSGGQGSSKPAPTG